METTWHKMNEYEKRMCTTVVIHQTAVTETAMHKER